MFTGSSFEWAERIQNTKPFALLLVLARLRMCGALFSLCSLFILMH